MGHPVALQTHIKSIHEGQKFLCSNCEYKDLQRHIKSVHVGQWFPCMSNIQHCDYKDYSERFVSVGQI